MAAFGRTFIRGLIVLIPATVTFYVVYWLGMIFEGVLGALVRLFIPDRFYLPGMGLLAGLGLVFLTGFLARDPMTQRVSRRLEGFIIRVPMINSVYLATQDIVSFFQRAKAGEFNQVVVVNFGTRGALLGFVTREDLTGLPEGIGGADMIAVYLPMSYQVGGYTLFLPRADVKPVEISVRDALRLAITAGVSTSSADDAITRQGP